MQWLSRGDRLLIGAGLILFQALVGCATSSDLKELDASLTQKVGASNTAVQSDVEELRNQLKAVEAAQEKRHQEVAQTLHALRADTKAVAEKVTEGEARRTQMLQEIRDGTAKTNQQLDRMIRVSAGLVKELHDVENALLGTLLGTYQAEEAALRGRLKVLTEVRQQLEAVNPPHQEAIETRQAGTAARE